MNESSEITHTHTHIQRSRMEIPMYGSPINFSMDGGNSEKKVTADREFQFVIDWQHKNRNRYAIYT